MSNRGTESHRSNCFGNPAILYEKLSNIRLKGSKMSLGLISDMAMLHIIETGLFVALFCWFMANKPEL